MEKVAKPETRERTENSGRKRPLVFLDSNVIIDYLLGEPSTVQLFSAEAEGRVRFAINPIVLQELLLAGDAARPEFEQISDHLRVLPVNYAKAEALLPRVRALGDHLPHPNDILVLSSAIECDFLVTRDARLKTLVTTEKPQVVTPEEFVAHLQAA